MALIPTQRNMYSYSILYVLSPSKLLFIIILHIVFCFTINVKASPFPLDTCLDSDKPVISIDIGNCTPATFNQGQNFCNGYLSLKASASDNQTPDELLLFDYKIDLYNDGRGAYGGFDFRVGPLSSKEFKNSIDPIFHDNPMADNGKNPFDASGTYPIGIHKICWYVEDSCGNTAALCQLFEVKDCEAPMAVCVGGTQIFNINNNGCYTLIAKEFNRGSIDNCTSSDKLYYYFNGKPADSVYVVCCDDYIAANSYPELPLNLQMWVEDEMGNSDFCNISVLVVDYRGACPIDGLSNYVYGDLICLKNGIENVLIPNLKMNSYQNGILIRSLIPKNSFAFYFDFKPGPFTINAYKENDPLNNVTTLDIIYIERHLHNLDKFKNEFQLIAADVDRNNEISYSDISEIRDLILGEISQFQNTLPWKVLAISSDSILLKNPVENIEFEFDKKNKIRIDFRIIKMGDVNDFASPSNYTPLKRTNDSLIFNFKNHQIHKGELVKIDLSSNVFKSIVGFQGTFKFDVQKLAYKNYNSSAIILDNNNLGIKNIQLGLVTISWNDIYQRTYPSNITLFSLEFEALEDGDLCDALSFTSDLTPAEAYTDSILIKNIKLESCDMILSNHDPFDQNIVVYPNPFSDILHFGFTDKILFPVQLNLYDQNGRQVETIKIPTAQSLFSWKVNSLHSGIYFVKITNDHNISFKKIVKL